jgi:phosphohistidine phosphatase
MTADRTLVLLRHSKAAWPDGVKDLQRPLAPRGRRDAPVAGRWLRDNLAVLDLVVLSPALRVQQTWELASAELGYNPPVQEDERLYTDSADQLLQLTRELSDDAPTVLFVGHNPELSVLASVLSGRTMKLSTSSIAVLDISGSWREIAAGRAELRSSVTPRAE